MRAPLPIVFLLTIAVVAVTWWQGTRGLDFLTPPGEEKLALARLQAAKIGSVSSPNDLPALSNSQGGQASEPDASTEPEIKLGSLETAPGLEAYAVDSQQGADHLVKLATALEAKGSFQRALLAWERVIDLGKAEVATRQTAFSAVKRLRPTLPTWNIDPEGAIPLVLHAGTGPATAPGLKPLLEEAARLLGQASDGVIAATPDLAIGKKAVDATGPAPVAIWLSGPANDTRSSEVFSFTVSGPATLRDQLLRTLYLLVSSQLKSKIAYTPPLPLEPADEPVEALATRVTRLCWREMATGLNLPLPKSTPVPGPPRQGPRRNR
ncbi:MAG: hypothetical protein WCH40_02495 [Verrucomicrobiales bacterium]